MSKNKLYVGMDVHKDSVMIAVLAEGASEPTVVRRLPNDARKLRRFLDEWDETGRSGAATRPVVPATCWSERSGAGGTVARSWRRR